MKLSVGMQVSLHESSEFAHQIRKWQNNIGVITDIEGPSLFGEIWYEVVSGGYQNGYRDRDLKVRIPFKTNKDAKSLLSKEGI